MTMITGLVRGSPAHQASQEPSSLAAARRDRRSRWRLSVLLLFVAGIVRAASTMIWMVVGGWALKQPHGVAVVFSLLESVADVAVTIVGAALGFHRREKIENVTILEKRESARVRA